MTRTEFELRFFGFLKWVSVVFFVVITAFPLLYMVSLSFKPIEEVLRNPGNPLPGFDDVLGLETYRAVLRPVSEGGQGFMTFIRNSAIVSFSTVAITTSLAIFGAYAAARLNFKGKSVVQGGILMVYLFPAIVVAIPLFVIFSRLSLRSSLIGLIIVYLAQTIPVAMYMLRSQFEAIPDALEEAGLIDGLTRFGVITKITIPLAAPAIAAVALYVFMIAWNEYLFALLFVADSRELWTLSLGVDQLDTTEVPKTMLMAGAVVITVPVIALFFIAERFLTEGLAAGGVKG